MYSCIILHTHVYSIIYTYMCIKHTDTVVILMADYLDLRFSTCGQCSMVLVILV